MFYWTNQRNNFLRPRRNFHRRRSTRFGKLAEKVYQSFFFSRSSLRNKSVTDVSSPGRRVTAGTEGQRESPLPWQRRSALDQKLEVGCECQRRRINGGEGGGENRKLLPYPLPCPLTKEIHCHKIIKLKS